MSRSGCEDWMVKESQSDVHLRHSSCSISRSNSCTSSYPQMSDMEGNSLRSLDTPEPTSSAVPTEPESSEPREPRPEPVRDPGRDTDRRDPDARDSTEGRDPELKDL